MGWLMVSSGLVDRPSVSHFLLAAHLFLALMLIGLAVWTALGHRYGFVAAQGRRTAGRWPARSPSSPRIGLLIQMAYGAFTAGLRAGHVSNTWPLMLGRWVPPALLRSGGTTRHEPDRCAPNRCLHPSLAALSSCWQLGQWPST